MELINVKLTENQSAPSTPKEKPGTTTKPKPTTRPERPKREDPFEPKHEPGPKALVKQTNEEEENTQKIKLPNALKFNNIGIKFRDQK